MVLFVLEAHSALHFGSCIDERAQGIARQRVIISASVDVLELASFVIVPLGILSLEQEALDFVGGVQRVTFLLVQRLSVALQDATNVGAVRRAALVNDFAENQDFARTEHVRGSPIEGGPVYAQPQIALALGGEAANGGTVEGEVVPALDQKLLVVIEHVQSAFEIAEEH